MKFNCLTRNLAPYLLLMLVTIYIPTALATPLTNCAIKLLPIPRALDLDKVKSNTFTAQADRFMQEMWESFASGQNVATVKSDLFTQFIQEHLQELVDNHERNRVYAKQDAQALSKKESLLDKNLASIDLYIQSLQFQLNKKQNFSYSQLLVFSYMLVLSRERMAYETLMVLYKKNDPYLVRKRYPGLSMSNLADTISERRRYLTFFEFWSEEYHYSLPINKEPDMNYPFQQVGALRHGRVIEVLKNNLALPTHYPMGTVSYYRLFHFPLNPLFLAKEYELVDNSSLRSPLGNLLHDMGHLADATTREYIATHQNYITTQELEDIRKRVLSKNDPELLPLLYFLAYYVKFEKEPHEPAYLSVKAFRTELQDLFSKFTDGSSNMIRRYFEYYSGRKPPITESQMLGIKFAELIYIISIYEQEKTCGGSRLNCFLDQSVAMDQYNKNLQIMMKWGEKQK